jgi:hypothetical protein
MRAIGLALSSPTTLASATPSGAGLLIAPIFAAVSIVLYGPLVWEIAHGA